MALSALFQVYMFVNFIASGSCIAGANELESLAQGGDGQLIYNLLLKMVSGLETDMKELKEQVEDDGRYIEELKAQVAELESKNRDKSKTVFAQMQLQLPEPRTRVYKPGDRVYFTTTIANMGNAYDTRHGYFEAPYDGTYLFSLTMCTSGNNHVDFFIVHEDIKISSVFIGDVDWTTCGSSTTVTQMKSGQRVWVEIDRVYGGRVNTNHGIPSFTGVLINNYEIP